ncbi:histone-lysine N-methyltransferase SETMAR-like [Ptiloglossa arizonensis]|uniref:histone-lysine N-methyltransferase SETMAR-like n=1 Tax=Ptiloglossa arizonensis TaxID=3350558 RepID=UPI003FA14EC2
MDPRKLHLRHSMLYKFNFCYNATETYKNLCFVFGPSKVNVCTVRRWFEKFRSGHTNLQDEPRTGRPKKLDDDVLRILVDNESLLTTRMIEERFNVCHTTIENHLSKFGFVYKWYRWTPCELNEKNMADRISIASSLLSRQQYEPLLGRLVTGDEKWIVYNNVVRKRAKVMSDSSSLAKDNVHVKKR